MRARPVIRCFVARPGVRGLAFDVELVLLEEAAARVTQGWWMVGPDPEDEIAFNLWLREVNAQFSVDYDPGDEE